MEFDFSQAIETLQALINNLITATPNILFAFLVFCVFYMIGWGLRSTVVRVSNRYRRNYNLGIVLGRLTQWSVVLLGLLVGLVIIFPRFTPAQLIQLLGLGSVAIGFAFRDILENFLGGILMLVSEPFKIGDQIIVEGIEGTVEAIDARATIIRRYDGRRVVIPNGKIYTNIITVNTAFDKRRQEYEVGVSYDANIREAKQLILETLREVPHVLSEPAPDVLVMELAESTVVLRVRWWITPPQRSDALETIDGVLSRVKERLPANGISLPYPIVQVNLNGEHELERK